MSGEYMTDDVAFAALVDKQKGEYAKLSDAKLAKKIRHLRGAIGRMTLPRNAQLMEAYLGAAVEIALSRRGAKP